MSHATDMREQSASAHDNPAPPWHVVPRDEAGGWRVYDGDEPVAVAEFTSKSDAVAFAWHKAAEPSFGGETVLRPVVVHPRAEAKEGVEEEADAARRPRQFGSSRGKVRMAPDFDEWPPEYEEFFG